eukprot:6178695-Pleurochrysis_carterae.AAC.2
MLLFQYVRAARDSAGATVLSRSYVHAHMCTCVADARESGATRARADDTAAFNHAVRDATKDRCRRRTRGQTLRNRITFAQHNKIRADQP